MTLDIKELARRSADADAVSAVEHLVHAHSQQLTAMKEYQKVFDRALAAGDYKVAQRQMIYMIHFESVNCSHRLDLMCKAAGNLLNPEM